MSTIGWDKQLEFGLPDSRLAVRRDITVPRLTPFGKQEMELVFCASCGADGGLITADWSPFVFYVCDECVAKHAAPAGLTEAPEAAVRGGA